MIGVLVDGDGAGAIADLYVVNADVGLLIDA